MGHDYRPSRYVTRKAPNSINITDRSHNLKGFPPDHLKRYNLAAQHPDDFIFDLLNLDAARVCEAASNHRRSLRNPPKTVDEYLDTLLRQGLTLTVGQLQKWKVAI
jgi:hypothetical protein